jgi:hypothetical protein
MKSMLALGVALAANLGLAGSALAQVDSLFDSHPDSTAPLGTAIGTPLIGPKPNEPPPAPYRSHVLPSTRYGRIEPGYTGMPTSAAPPAPITIPPAPGLDR